MSSVPAPWPRPLHQHVGGTALVAMRTFARARLDLGRAMDAQTHGVPERFPLELITVRQRLRHEEPAGFDDFLSPEIRALAQLQLGSRGAGVTGHHAIYDLTFELMEPRDLGYLQACWAVQRWLCEHGAEYIFDMYAMRWCHREQLMASDPNGPLDIQREIFIVFENQPEGDFGHIMHTRGLLKFGRPDLVIFGVPPDDATLYGKLLNHLGDRAAQGAPLVAGQKVGLTSGQSYSLQTYEPGRAHPQLNLNNAGLVIDLRQS